MKTSWYFEYYFTHILDPYPTIAIVFIVVFLIIVMVWGGVKNWSDAIKLLTYGYFVFIVYVTIISRETNDCIKYSLIPFYSYSEVAKGDVFLLVQVIMNIIMYLPSGVLIKASIKKWSYLRVFAICALFSLMIELLQLVFHKGSAEVDDILHNTIGCAIGLLFFYLSGEICKKVKNRIQNKLVIIQKQN